MWIQIWIHEFKPSSWETIKGIKLKDRIQTKQLDLRRLSSRRMQKIEAVASWKREERNGIRFIIVKFNQCETIPVPHPSLSIYPHSKRRRISIYSVVFIICNLQIPQCIGLRPGWGRCHAGVRPRLGHSRPQGPVSWALQSLRIFALVTHHLSLGTWLQWSGGRRR